MEKFSNNWKRRRGNFMGGRSIIDIVCALEILGVVLFLTAPQFVMNYLILNPRLSFTARSGVLLHF